MAKEFFEGPGGALLSYDAVLRGGDDNRNAAAGRNDAARRDNPMAFQAYLDIAAYNTASSATATSNPTLYEAVQEYGPGTLGVFFYDSSRSNPAENRCPKGCVPVVTMFQLFVIGASWTGGTDIRLSDSSLTNDFAIVQTAGLTQNSAYSLPDTAGTIGSFVNNAKILAPMCLKGGATENGLILRTTGTFAAGGEIVAYVEGYFRPVS